MATSHEVPRESESEPECPDPRTSRSPRARRAQVVEKCLDAGLVPFVIKLLTGGSLEGAAEGPAVKGHGVRLLKKMAGVFFIPAGEV